MIKKTILFFLLAAICSNQAISQPAPEVAEIKQQQVIVSALLIREQPSQKSKQIGRLESGKVIWTIARTTTKDTIEIRGVRQASFWYKMQVYPKFGWVFGGCLTDQDDPGVQAPLTLIDSFEFGKRTLAVVSDQLLSGHQLFMLRRGWIERNSATDTLDEIVFKNKYTIKVPYYSNPIYMDQHYLYLTQFIRGNPALDEEGKYIDGRRIFAKYEILTAGRLRLVDSVGISREALTVAYQGALPTSPIIITTPTAVEGGWCNNQYFFYDDHLKFRQEVKPDLPNCSEDDYAYVDDQSIHLIDRDYNNDNTISWCIADHKLEHLTKRRLEIDKNFLIFHIHVDNGLLHLSGRFKADSIPPVYQTLVYNPEGVLVEKFKTNISAVGQSRKIGEKRFFVDYNNISMGVLNRGTETIIKNPKFYGQKTIVSDKLIIYNKNKIFIYTIN
jgi:hypothetical protein